MPGRSLIAQARKGPFGLALAAGLLLLPGTGRAEDPAASRPEEPASVPRPWEGLAGNLGESFLGVHALYHLAAVGSEVALQRTELDFQVHRYFRARPAFGWAAAPGAVLGAGGAVLAAGGLYLGALRWEDREMLGAASAVLQAGALTLAYVTALKLLVGRPPPHDSLVPELAPDVKRLSHRFRFGFNRGGVFYGWPSGHVAATTAVAAALAHYYPDAPLWRYLGLGAVAYMVFSVAAFERGGMHWLSDGLSGLLFAYPIGASVGRDFRRRVDGRPLASTGWELCPLPLAGGAGLSVAGSL